jgi:hypothetical protein
MDARREADARVWDYAEQRDIEGLLEERRRQTTENLAQRRSGFKSGGSKSGGSKSGGLEERLKGTSPPPRRELTPPRRPTPPRARVRTLPRAPTPPRDRTRSDRRGNRCARTASPPPRRRLRSDSRDRGPPRTTQERRPGPSSRGGKKSLPMGAQLTSYLAPGQAFSEGIESTAVLSGGTRRFTLPTLRERAVALPRAH